MIAFANKVVKPYIVESGYRLICEIGSRFGENSDALLGLSFVALTVIDPALIWIYPPNIRMPRTSLS
jgi:hypothetical protein